jgi:hypothetical protein
MDAAVGYVAFAERIALQNVVSARATFHYREMADRLEDFASSVTSSRYSAKGPLIYSLNNVPLDEMVDVEMFLPVHEASVPEGDGLLFHSYFEVFPLLRGTVVGDFQTQTEHVYARLLATLEAADLDLNSPFYHVVEREVVPSAAVYVGYVARDPGDA